MGKAVALLFALLVIVSLVVFPLPVKAEDDVIVVPDDCSTIQAAIIRADEGDTVYVKAGTYNGTIKINKSIALIGEKNKAVINDWYIDGTAAVLITHSNVTVSGITIDNPSSNTGWNEKRGIHLLAANNCTITNNIVLNCDYGEGIWLYQSQNNLIEGNTVENGNIGIHIGLSTDNTIINNIVQNNDQGISLYYSADNNQITKNQVSRNSVGLALDGSSRNVFDSNRISDNSCGFQIGGYYTPLGHSERNLFIHNNFVGNTKTTESYVTNVDAAIFDNGREGNYYSNYKGEDHNRDGVGDTSYNMVSQGADFIDNYPLMQPWVEDNLPPIIAVISPENTTYTTGEVPLNFTVSKATSEIKYSLDGSENITIAENMTLTGLANGNHTVTIYATGLVGSEGAPKTVNFTVALPFVEVLPFLPLVAVAVIVLVAIVVSVGWFVYRRKHGLVKKP